MSRMTDEELEDTIRKSRQGPRCNYRAYRAIESEARRRAFAESIERIGSHKVCDCKETVCAECDTLEWAIGCIQDIMREDTIQRHAQEEQLISPRRMFIVPDTSAWRRAK